jgi:hypothetical protein
MNEKFLCEAFCRDVTVRRVPRGWAVSTPFETSGGDPLGFYIVRNSHSGKWHVEDDGTSIAFLEALGISLSSGTRKEAFDALLTEYSVIYDNKSGELHSFPVDEFYIGETALNFMAMMLRLQDFSLMHPTTVESTFKDDARAAIDARFSSIAKVRHEQDIGSPFRGYTADSIIEIEGREPVAIYYGTSNDRINEAVILWMEVHHIVHSRMPVVLLLETPTPKGVSQKPLTRAYNYLDGIAAFRGEERSAIEKLWRYVENAPEIMQ